MIHREAGVLFTAICDYMGLIPDRVEVVQDAVGPFCFAAQVTSGSEIQHFLTHDIRDCTAQTIEEGQFPWWPPKRGYHTEPVAERNHRLPVLETLHGHQCVRYGHGCESEHGQADETRVPSVPCSLSGGFGHERYCMRCVDMMKRVANEKGVRCLVAVGAGAPVMGLSYTGGMGSKMIHRSHEQTKDFDIHAAVEEILRAADRNKRARERRWGRM